MLVYIGDVGSVTHPHVFVVHVAVVHVVGAILAASAQTRGTLKNKKHN